MIHDDGLRLPWLLHDAGSRRWSMIMVYDASLQFGIWRGLSVIGLAHIASDKWSSGGNADAAPEDPVRAEQRRLEDWIILRGQLEMRMPHRRIRFGPSRVSSKVSFKTRYAFFSLLL
ncbi:uncharacterized protein LOC105184765 [Harpegnathos saltator]|uniref:uncharacterized protein LOC105184765 n=1 Tax=Harpegnathos saltator TaxID=610380 RepID=UPI000DBEE9DF|nr:uncharacterized protein LOC105184765 [Harpegnathos saltator]